jgi:hypothetical protein
MIDYMSIAELNGPQSWEAIKYKDYPGEVAEVSATQIRFQPHPTFEVGAL